MTILKRENWVSQNLGWRVLSEVVGSKNLVLRMPKKCHFQMERDFAKWNQFIHKIEIIRLI